MRRILTVAVWVAAVLAMVVAIGLRIQAKRNADPAQALRPWLPGVASPLPGAIIARGPGSLQIALDADEAWVRAFASHHGFEPLDGPVGGFAAERWVRIDPAKPQAVVHLLLPLDGTSPLITVSGP